MLERYFLKPQTLDRIRGSWLGESLERYVTWLADQGYAARNIYRRVPLLMQFGEFAREHGATSLEDLPAHVAPSRRRDASAARTDASAGPVLWTMRSRGRSGSFCVCSRPTTPRETVVGLTADRRSSGAHQASSLICAMNVACGRAHCSSTAFTCDGWSGIWHGSAPVIWRRCPRRS